MPSFSRTSTVRLQQCDPRLQRVMNRVVKTYDCTILQGHRGKEAQDEAWATGRSKVRWPEGKHNSWPSRAADVAPWPLDWMDRDRFHHFAGFVQGVAEMMGTPLRWGGDWDGDRDLADQTFDDLVHFELKG